MIVRLPRASNQLRTTYVRTYVTTYVRTYVPDRLKPRRWHHPGRRRSTHGSPWGRTASSTSNACASASWGQATPAAGDKPPLPPGTSRLLSLGTSRLLPLGTSRLCRRGQAAPAAGGMPPPLPPGTCRFWGNLCLNSGALLTLWFSCLSHNVFSIKIFNSNTDMYSID